MNIEHPYWYFHSAIPIDVCDQIIDLASSKPKMSGTLGSRATEKRDSKRIDGKVRDSSVTWINDEWIYKLIHPYIKIANKNAGWNFQWDFSEPCQFTEYTKGQFYGWHCDSALKPHDKPNDKKINGKIRKLSLTLTLSNREDYEGGDLQFDYKNNKGKATGIIDAMRDKGSLVVFPSFVWHRVTKVTSGKRHSLVSWNLGKPFI